MSNELNAMVDSYEDIIEQIESIKTIQLKTTLFKSLKAVN